MRRSAYEVGLWEFVRRGVGVVVISGGKVGGEVVCAANGGDIVGGEAVMVAI